MSLSCKDKHIKIAITDLNGVLRSKYLSKEKFEKSLSHGFGFCDVIVGSDINDELIDKLQFTGWQTGYPDSKVTIIKDSQRQLPFEDGRTLYLCEFDTDYASLCPRQTLKKIIQKGERQGYQAECGMEFEFTLFEETPQSAHQKQFKNLKPLTPGNCGYSFLRSSMLSEFYDELLSVTEACRIPLEGLHTEIGPGVLEAAIAKSSLLEAADRASLFKSIVKTLAHRRGWMASFMAKWSTEHQGQSGHIHLSLKDSEQQTVFYDATKPHNISDAMLNFVAGQQFLMPEFLLLSAPFVNSYARLVPGFWAPTDASFGIDNRTCAIRAVLGGEHSQRIEYRIPAADCNPYLAMSAALASGLWGIANKRQPEAPISGNAYEQPMADEYQLPRTIGQSAQRFLQSEIAKDYFEPQFIEDYVKTREWEETLYQTAVTDWQLERYFELA